MRIELHRSAAKSTVRSPIENETHGPHMIEGLELSTRAYHVLRQAGCRTVDDVHAKWPDGILRVNGAGHRFAWELYESWRLMVPNPSSMPPPDTLRKRVAV